MWFPKFESVAIFIKLVKKYDWYFQVQLEISLKASLVLNLMLGGGADKNN